MTDLDRIRDESVLESFSRCQHCPVVFEYMLQFTGDGEKVDENYMWSKGD